MTKTTIGLNALLVLPLLVGCGAPEGLEPLDLAPPKTERGLWEYDASGYLRYDGHPLGVVSVQEPDGTRREWTIEGERQPAGDYETRARLLTRDDGTSVEVLAVGTLAEKAYFEAVTAQVASADVVLAAVRARGLERDEDKAAAAAHTARARATVEALRQRVTFVGDALQADARWREAHPDAKALARRRAALPGEEELAEVVEDMRALVEEHGADVVVHVIAVSRVRPRTGIALASRGPIGEAGYALDLPPGEADPADDFTWERRTLRDACLDSLEPLLAEPGPRRVALLVPAITARAVTAALLKKGFVVREERWLRAIRLARP